MIVTILKSIWHRPCRSYYYLITKKIIFVRKKLPFLDCAASTRNALANITSISGSWTGILLDNETAGLTIASNGNLSGTSSPDYTFSGTAIARPSGTNIFNLTLSFAGAPCEASNKTLYGIAFSDRLTSGLNQLVACVVGGSGNATNSAVAIVFSANR
jgi:hypothetical protein